LLTATFKDLHIENSKNHKRWYCPHHTDCVSMCCFCDFCCFVHSGMHIIDNNNNSSSSSSSSM